MERKEFCEIVTDIRKKSSVKMKDICAQMGTLPTAIYRLERGTGNFEMGNMVLYLRILGCRIVVIDHNSQYQWLETNDFSKFLPLIRQENNISQRILADKVGCVYTTIANIERGTNIVSIDTFLKIVDVLGCELKIESI